MILPLPPSSSVLAAAREKRQFNVLPDKILKGARAKKRFYRVTFVTSGFKDASAATVP